MINNAETSIIQLFAFLLLAIVGIAMSSYCKNDRCKCFHRLKASLVWNGLIRLFMETYFELLLTSTLNIAHGNWDWDVASRSYSYSLVLSIIVLSICLLAPICLIIFFLSRRVNWSDQPFIVKYGSLLQDTARKNDDDESINKRIILLVPFVFFARRLILVLLILFVSEFWY